MSGYNPRRGPNVFQYLKDLNNASPENPQPDAAAFDLENDDLASFINSDIWDIERGGNIPNTGFELAAPFDEQTDQKYAASQEIGNVNLENAPYIFPEFSLDQNAPIPSTNFPASNFDPLYPAPTAAFLESPHTGDKRPFGLIEPPMDEATRLAAEEDKRRRNTAASARFRVKKKQREAALEKSAKEMTDKVDALHARVSHLEMENKWLRRLVIDKGVDIESERSKQSAKKGVGTEKKEVEA